MILPLKQKQQKNTIPQERKKHRMTQPLKFPSAEGWLRAVLKPSWWILRRRSPKEPSRRGFCFFLPAAVVVYTASCCCWCCYMFSISFSWENHSAGLLIVDSLPSWPRQLPLKLCTMVAIGNPQASDDMRLDSN